MKTLFFFIIFFLQFTKGILALPPGELSEKRYIGVSQHPLVLEESDGEADTQIISYIRKYIENNETPLELTTGRGLRFSLKALALGLGGTAGIPFVPMALRAAQGNKALEIAFATGTITSSGLASAWVGLRMVSRFDPASEEERYFNERLRDNPLRTHVCANSLAVLSTLPNIYSVYKYNTLKWLTVPVFIVGYFSRVEGYYSLFDMLRNVSHTLCGRGSSIEKLPRESNGDRVRTEIIPFLLGERSDSVDAVEGKRAEIVRILGSVLDATQKEGDIPFRDRFSKEEKCGKWLRKVVQNLSLLCPVANLLINSSLSYAALEAIGFSPLFCYPATIVVAASGFALDSVLLTAGVGEICDAMYAKLNKKEQKDFVSVSFPLVSKSLPVVCLILSAFSAMGDSYVATDVTSNSSFAVLLPFLPTIVFAANTVINAYSCGELCRVVIRTGCKYLGDGAQRRKIGLVEHLETVAALFEHRAILQRNKIKEEEGNPGNMARKKGTLRTILTKKIVHFFFLGSFVLMFLVFVSFFAA